MLGTAAVPIVMCFPDVAGLVKANESQLGFFFLVSRLHKSSLLVVATVPTSPPAGIKNGGMVRSPTNKQGEKR